MVKTIKMKLEQPQSDSEEPIPMLHIDMEDYDWEDYAMVSTEEVNGINEDGRPCNGILLFLYNATSKYLNQIKKDC